MSAFVVDDRTINRVVTFLYSSAVRDPASGLASYPKRIEEAAAITADTESERPSALAAQMHALNARAVNARYSERNRSDGYRFLTATVENKCQVLKSLLCWLYQCIEGEIPEQPLWIVLNEFSKALALDIVRELPEYHEAEWG
jgi:hypothetical protein